MSCIPAPASSAATQSRKSTALERKNLKWESHKAEIRAIYLDQDRTLNYTMQFFEQQHGLKSSRRKWKDKLKEWEFEKNVPSSDMAFMVAKAEKRKLEDGKDTTFSRCGILVDESKIEEFKKRKFTSSANSLQTATPETPPQISYQTPKPFMSDDHEDQAASSLRSQSGVPEESLQDPRLSSKCFAEASEPDTEHHIGEYTPDDNHSTTIVNTIVGPDDNANPSNNVIHSLSAHTRLIDISDDDKLPFLDTHLASQIQILGSRVAAELQYLNGRTDPLMVESLQSFWFFSSILPPEEVARSISQDIQDEYEHNSNESTEDSKSSNKYGITYTESLSGMTDISFNYSAFYR